jgi:hypothetical protein
LLNYSYLFLLSSPFYGKILLKGGVSMSICPSCGKPAVGKINPLPGTTGYFLVSVNENANPPTVEPSGGLVVQVSGCASCGALFFSSDKLKNKIL